MKNLAIAQFWKMHKLEEKMLRAEKLLSEYVAQIPPEDMNDYVKQTDVNQYCEECGKINN